MTEPAQTGDAIRDLVIKAQGGDTQAFEALHQRFEKMALSYAYSLLGDRDLAEDARQNTFISAYLDLMTLREPAAFPGWLRTIVRRQSTSLKRGRSELLVPMEGPPPDLSEPLQQHRALERQERESQVQRALRSLPKPEAEVVRLYYMEELSLSEIEGLTGLEKGTIKSKLHQARTRMRSRLIEGVKGTVAERGMAGRKAVIKDASEEAIALFDERIRAILRRPTEAEEREAGQYLCAKGRIFRYMGRSQDAMASFEEGLTIPAVKRSPVMRARMRAEIGLTYLQSSDYPKARTQLKASQQILERQNEKGEELATVFNGLGSCAWGQGRFKQAQHYYTLTADLSRKHGLAELEAESTNNLALLHWKSGRLPKAQDQFQVALKKWQGLKNRFGESLTLINLGIMEEQAGRLARAEQRYSRALTLAREINFVMAQAAIHGNLSNLALLRDKLPMAIEHGEQSREISARIGDRRSEAIALENIGLAHLGLRDWKASGAALRDAHKIAKAIGDRERLLSVELAEYELELEQRSKSKNLAERLRTTGTELKRKGFKAELPRWRRLLAQAHQLAGESAKAAKELRQAIDEAEKQGNMIEKGRCEDLEKRWIPSSQTKGRAR